MNNMAEKLLEELTVQYPISIPIGSYQLKISESVVVTWLIMAVMLALAIFLTRGLRVNNVSRRQAVAELIVTKTQALVEDMIGEHGKQYAPYLMTVLFYLGMANLIGLFDMKLFGASLKSPTKDLNVTAALALMSIILVEYAGIHQKGVLGWLKSFAEPVALIAPINFLEIFIRPLSLCMRLFGNILGAFVIMELLKMVVPVVLPAFFSCYFDIFDGLIQAYIFVFLTSMFIKEAVE